MRKVLCILVALFVSACATGPKTSEATKKYIAESKIVDTKNIHAAKCNSLSYAKNKKWQDWIEYANACVKKKNWRRVKAYGILLSETEANSPWGPYYQSLAAENSGNLQKSLWMVDLALKKAPKLAILFYQKARIEWNLGNYESAVGHLKTSVNFDSNNLQAHLFLGQIYFRDNEVSKASQHFHSILILEPENKIALYGIAEAKVEAKDYAGAVRDFDKLIELNKKELAYHLRKAEIIEKHLGNKKLAIELYQKINTDYRKGKLRGEMLIDITLKIKKLKQSQKLAKN